MRDTPDLQGGMRPTHTHVHGETTQKFVSHCNWHQKHWNEETGCEHACEHALTGTIQKLRSTFPSLNTAGETHRHCGDHTREVS